MKRFERDCMKEEDFGNVISRDKNDLFEFDGNSKIDKDQFLM